MIDPEKIQTENFKALSEPGEVGPWTYGLGFEEEPIDGRYSPVGKMARTSTSEVYAALDHESGEVVAFKSYYDANEEDFIKNTWERQLIQAFDHPNIISALDVGEHDQNGVLRRYLVTPLATRTLRETRAHNEDEARDVYAGLGQLAAGVEALRQRSVLHQDVKPGNSFEFIKSDGTKKVVIGDLGTVASTPVIESDRQAAENPDPQIAKILGERAIRPKKFNGYVPPEAHKLRKIDEACDIYALGAMAIEMLTGKLPRIEPRRYDSWVGEFQGDRIISPDPIFMPGHVPKEITETAYACLEEKPENRPTASELRGQFEAAL